MRNRDEAGDRGDGVQGYGTGTSRSAALHRAVARELRSARLRVLLFSAVVLALAALLWQLPHVAAEQQPHYLQAGHLHLAWPLLAVMFGSAEVYVLHVQVNREARTVSLSGIVLVLAFFFSSPEALLVARVVGPMLVFLVHRRQSPLKLVFNAALLLADVSLALAVFGAVLDGSPATGPRSWVATLLALALSETWAAAAVTIVIAIYEYRLHLRDLGVAAVTGLVGSSMVGTIGLIAVNALTWDRRTAWLLAVALATLLLGFRAYASLTDRHLALERLYHFSQAVSGTPGVDKVLESVLLEAKELLRSEYAEVAFLGGPGAVPGLRVAHGLTGLQRGTEDARLPEWLSNRLLVDGQPVLLARGTRSQHERDYLRERGHRECIVVPLPGESGPVGALSVADRLGDVRTFDESDVRLLETVANHAGVALRNGALIDQLTHEALHDSLTGLPNRALLQRRLDDALEALRRHSTGLAVMIMDLDGFKEVNDTLGHHAGDVLLQEVAQRLREALPPAATVARLGGDEFAVLLPDVPAPEDALVVARHLASALEPPIRVQGIDLRVGGSLGVAVAPLHGQDASGLLKRADMAMYDAKGSSSSRIRLYQERMSTTTPEQLALAGELRDALTLDQLEVFVQPKIDLRAKRVTAVEALVRWRHPRLGLLTPDVFLPLAERAGLIRELTTAVLHRSVDACAGWLADGVRVGIAVNLSARSLDDIALADEVEALLARRGLPGGLLTLEITETSIMTDPARSSRLLERLTGIGVRISVDDFGTGYSSLAYLTRLPVQEIKIDRSFVMGMVSSATDETVVRAITDLGSSLDLTVVAEGVEEPETVERLARIGCDLAQGYAVSRPMPVAEFLPWLADYRPASAHAGAGTR